MMWVWTEDKTAMVNLDHCFLLILRSRDEGWYITAHKDRGDMGSIIKTFTDEKQAREFIQHLGATANSRDPF